MGAAIWLRAAAADAVALPAGLPAPEEGCRYRIEVLGEPRAPWRASPAEAMADAIAIELAAWDGERREHFLAVPVDMKVVRPERRRAGPPANG